MDESKIMKNAERKKNLKNDLIFRVISKRSTKNIEEVLGPTKDFFFVFLKYTGCQKKVTVDPPYNEPPYNELLYITNMNPGTDFL
ncbi:hypothetical protein BpHYR1_026276 [Brachionus plicatilis]|uniref:Uncharacterized protein n=1 Tax=Brachionus plicatilis TaxID=10195 RepID=A0A3M7QVY1_BRAPC|nr:hypothetical protein BpHYR1_026276 [Brachionus plicatilis]